MESNPNDKLVQLKSLEALKEIADGDANKVFIPFDATSALSSLGAMKEAVTDSEKKESLKKELSKKERILQKRIKTKIIYKTLNNNNKIKYFRKI